MCRLHTSSVIASVIRLIKVLDSDAIYEANCIHLSSLVAVKTADVVVEDQL